MKAVGFLHKAACVMFSAALASTMVVAVPGASWAAEEADLTISNAADLAAFASRVNAGEDFAGKTVRLAANLTLEGVDNWTPIGTIDHPFRGTFDASTASGGCRTVSDMTVSATGSNASYLGLFGYVGAGGSVRNLVLEDAVVTATGTTDVAKCIGSIAGYVYGDIAGDGYGLLNCSSDAKVTVTSTLTIDEDKAENDLLPNDVIRSGYSDDYSIIEYVGGVAGFCGGSMDNVTSSGQLKVATDSAPFNDDATVARFIGGIVGMQGGAVKRHVTEDDAYAHEPLYPTVDGTGSPDGLVTSITNCSNSCKVTTVVNAEAGLDRFGVQTSARLYYVGGVAGYSMANIADCTNTAKIYAPTAIYSSGIVGCWRTAIYSSIRSSLSDPGTYKPVGADESQRISGPDLTLQRCSNSGVVYGLGDAGGIVGFAGTYTTLTQCANLKGADVHVTRWNSPSAGGIAGGTLGTICYCYNRACSSTDNELRDANEDYVYDEDGNHLYKQGGGGGYYVSGISGGTSRYTTEDGYDVTSPMPEIYGCYTTGDVLACSTYKQSGICGYNRGFLHDCYFLKDSVSFAGDLSSVICGENSGTIADTVVPLEDESASVTASDLLKSKAYTAKLNAAASIDDYEQGCCFVPSPDEDTNDGYALLAWQRTDQGQTIDESKLTYEGTGQAAYSAVANSMPSLKVSYDGSELVQGADYYAVPDSLAAAETGGCKDVSELSGTVLNASIVGIGDYASNGATEWKAPYTLEKGDFSTCSVAIKSKTFNFCAQYPSQPTDGQDSDVVISDAAGGRISADAFTMAPDTGKCVSYKYTFSSQSYDGLPHTGYEIAFTAKEDSNYVGTTYGYFIINKATLINKDLCSISSISFNGQTWLYSLTGVYSSGKSESHAYRILEDGTEVAGMSIPYTGESIKPTIDHFYYLGGDGVQHELVYGSDYKIVYGDPGEVADLLSDDTAVPNLNVTDDTPGHRACFTFRYVPGTSHNFSNYQNVFFDIVPADVSKADQVTVEGLPESVAYENVSSFKPEVTLRGATGVALSNEYYSVESSYNSDAQTMDVTIVGSGNLTGTYAVSIPVTGVPARIKTAEKPTAARGLFFDGTAQCGVAQGEGYVLSGVAEATDAGTYEAVAELKEGYQWTDGSTDKVTLKWTIGKATQTNASITTSAKTIKGCKSGKLAKAASFTLSSSGVAEKASLSWSKELGPAKIKVSKAGKVTLKKGLKKGTYKLNVRLSVGATANYEATIMAKTISVKVK